MLRQRAFAFACAATATAALGFVSSPAQATTFTGSTTLDTLVKQVLNGSNAKVFNSNGNDFQVGDKLFSNFSLEISCTPADVPCDATKVGPLGPSPIILTDAPGGDIGIQFADHLFAQESAGIDLLLGYTVTSQGGPIIGAKLGYNGTYTGTGSTDIGEQVFDTSNNLLGGRPLHVYNSSVGSQFTDSISFADQQQISIQKDISLNSGSKGTANISVITQTYPQDPIPEPSAVGGLLAFGSVGVGLMLKRGKKNKDVVL